MVSVFISYRRADSGGWVRAIDERLTKALGRPHVFCDINSISAGADFEREIRDRILDCDVALVVIGPLWLTIADGVGATRLDDPDDSVRREIELALQAKLIVVPVTVGDAPLPDFRRLSATRLRRLAKRNAFNMSVKHFERDLDDLVAQLQRIAVGESLPAPADTTLKGANPLIAVEPEPEDSPSEIPGIGGTHPVEGGPAYWPDGPDAFAKGMIEAMTQLDVLSDGGADRPLGAQPLRIRIAADKEGWRFERAGDCGWSLNVPGPETVRVGPSALDQLLRRYRDQGRDLKREQGEMLFRMLVPRPWRAVFAAATGVQLQLDADSDRLPWESLWVPGAPLPLGLGASLMRDCSDPPPRRISAGELGQALVLGGAAPASFNYLPGAEEEVEAVSKTLAEAGLEVDKVVGADAFAAISLIAERNHRVMHLSGHSVVGWLPDNPGERGTEGGKREPLSGLVIGEGVVLTEHEVLMQDDVPELITLGTDNISHWGRTLRSAGCAVAIVADQGLDDLYGSLYFKTFYAELVRGVTAGAAAMRARIQIASDSGTGRIAALRLRFYGDPTYRLLAPTNPGASIEMRR